MKYLFKFNFLLSAVVALVMLLSFDDELERPPNTKVPICPFPDPGYIVFFSHNSACNWYWQCSNGLPYLNRCPITLCWDNRWKNCTYPGIVHDTTRTPKPRPHTPW